MCFMARLAPDEVTPAFEGIENEYPPILNIEQAAKLANVAVGTLRRLVSEGYFRTSVKRGRPMLFWRDKFVVELMAMR